MRKRGIVYILANKNHRVLYVGMTSDLISRIHDHKVRKYPNSFSAQYNVQKLVYYEVFDTMAETVAREKQLKAGKRKTKIDLVEGFNPEWRNLYEDILKW